MSEMRQATGRQVIRFQSFDDVIRVAQGLYQAQCTPAGVDRWQTLVPILLAGAELGLGVMASLKSITPPVNGQCTLYGDAGLALVRASGQLAKFEETHEGDGDDRRAVCVIQRAGQPEKRFEYSLALAKKLVSYKKQVDKKVGPWWADSDNMLSWRARWRALRSEFTDVLMGMTGAEEAEDEAITVEAAARPTPQLPPAAPPETPPPPAAPTDDQMAEIVRLRGLVNAAAGDDDRAAKAWADLLAPFGVATAKALPPDRAAEFIRAVGEKHDPFTHPTAS